MQLPNVIAANLCYLAGFLNGKTTINLLISFLEFRIMAQMVFRERFTLNERWL